MIHSTEKSWEKFRQTLGYLGSGSSTLSKIPVFEGIEPAQIVRGEGCRVWDVDGNEYIDYRNGLGPVTLGYCIPEINQAIIEQLHKGIVFGHPHVIEGEAAEALTEVIPCAEKVRFLKTGGEAIAACIKIARNATGRNRIVQCGYNGWLNVLSSGGFRPAGIAASQPLKGVPSALSELHSSLPWGDKAPWEEIFSRHGDEIAAVVIASGYQEMSKGAEFLPWLRELTQRHGCLMIMDEIVTGFRLALGGAHEYFRFMPDMAVFAKGCANGMPLAAYVGRADLIESSKTIGISSTYGGEALSLAAMKAVVAFYRQHDVIGHLWTIGQKLWPAVELLFRRYGIDAELKGFPVCPQFIFSPSATLSLDAFFRASYQHGVSFYNVSYVNYSHNEADVAITLERLEKAIQSASNAQP